MCVWLGFFSGLGRNLGEMGGGGGGGGGGGMEREREREREEGDFEARLSSSLRVIQLIAGCTDH